MSISLLVPTRMRPDSLLRFYNTAMSQARDPYKIEVIAFRDEDDYSYNDLYSRPGLTIISGNGLNLAEMWNECAKVARGNILGLFGDDVVFRTRDWDVVVEHTFNQAFDKCLLVYGHDGSPMGEQIATHFFLHRNWMNTVGYFVPPYFSAGYVDTWWNDVAKELGRMRYIPILTEHLHHGYGKSENDETYRLGSQRVIDDDLDALYNSPEMVAKRQADVEKLRAYIRPPAISEPVVTEETTVYIAHKDWAEGELIHKSFKIQEIKSRFSTLSEYEQAQRYKRDLYMKSIQQKKDAKKKAAELAQAKAARRRGRGRRR